MGKRGFSPADYGLLRWLGVPGEDGKKRRSSSSRKPRKIKRPHQSTCSLSLLYLSAVDGSGESGYSVEVLSTSQELAIETDSAVGLLAHRSYLKPGGPIDTLLVAGGLGAEEAAKDKRLLRWLKRMAPRVRRLGSICTGAFVLAAAGLLDGRRATTHWKWCSHLALAYPQVRVDADPIFVRDGLVYTSAGVTAGMDLALALVDEDFGRAAALWIARHLVLFARRPGGQSQFSVFLDLQAAEREPLRDLQTWVAKHLDQDLSVERLAGRVHMSSRNSSRVFRQQVGWTPARFVERVRVEAARRRLEESDAGLAQIARECGFGSPDSMRRSFLRVLRVAPADYRSRFHTGLLKEFTAANDVVVTSLTETVAWLKKDLLPKSRGKYALGADTFARQLLYEEMVDLPLDNKCRHSMDMRLPNSSSQTPSAAGARLRFASQCYPTVPPWHMFGKGETPGAFSPSASG